MKTSDTRSPTSTRAQADRERARVKEGLRYCVGVFLVLRVALTVLAVAGVAVLPGLSPVDVPGWPGRLTTPGWHNAVTAFERFDALWFLRIASEGYRVDDGSAVFFPGYPLTVRAISFVLGGRPLAAGMLVSNLATLGAMIGLYFLTASEHDEATARRTVLYLAVFPTAFFLVAPYTEALFLLLAVVSLWGARRGRWAVAGLAGAGAAAVRNIGVLLVLPLLVEAFHQLREGRREGTLGRVAWSLVPVASTVAYLSFWQVLSGDFLAPLNEQATWQRTFSLAPVTVARGTWEAFRFVGQYPAGYHLLDWLLVVPALAAAVWVAVRMRPVYAVYTWALLLPPLSYIFLPRPFMSLPRFLLWVFPILWAAAVWAGRRPAIHHAIVAISAAVLGLLTVLFVNWYFVF